MAKNGTVEVLIVLELNTREREGWREHESFRVSALNTFTIKSYISMMTEWFKTMSIINKLLIRLQQQLVI